MIQQALLLVLTLIGPFLLIWLAIGVVKMYKQHKAWESEEEESLTIE